MNYCDFFRAATGLEPYRYQCRLACGEQQSDEEERHWPSHGAQCESRLVSIPHRLGSLRPLRSFAAKNACQQSPKGANPTSHEFGFQRTWAKMNLQTFFWAATGHEPCAYQWGLAGGDTRRLCGAQLVKASTGRGKTAPEALAWLRSGVAIRSLDPQRAKGAYDF